MMCELSKSGQILWDNHNVLILLNVHIDHCLCRKLFREVLSTLHKYIQFHIEEKEVIKDINHHLDILWNEYRYSMCVYTMSINKVASHTHIQVNTDSICSFSPDM